MCKRHGQKGCSQLLMKLLVYNITLKAHDSVYMSLKAASSWKTCMTKLLQWKVVTKYKWSLSKVLWACSNAIGNFYHLILFLKVWTKGQNMKSPFYVNHPNSSRVWGDGHQLELSLQTVAAAFLQWERARPPGVTGGGWGGGWNRDSHHAFGHPPQRFISEVRVFKRGTPLVQPGGSPIDGWPRLRERGPWFLATASSAGSSGVFRPG